MKKWIALISFILLLLPAAAIAREKTHIPTQEDQECSECHGDQSKAWFDGKHGLMDVKCVVCHGSPEKNFAAKPDNTRCRGCHGEQVDQVMKKTAKAEKTCFPCHDHHTLAVKTAPKTPFHAKGGK